MVLLYIFYIHTATIKTEYPSARCRWRHTAVCSNLIIFYVMTRRILGTWCPGSVHKYNILCFVGTPYTYHNNSITSKTILYNIYITYVLHCVNSEGVQKSVEIRIMGLWNIIVVRYPRFHNCSYKHHRWAYYNNSNNNNKRSCNCYPAICNEDRSNTYIVKYIIIKPNLISLAINRLELIAIIHIIPIIYLYGHRYMSI